MKRYLLFKAENYYPSGGWGDFVDDFDSIKEARIKGEELTNIAGWFEIIDTTTKKEIE